jgi:transposase
MEAIYRPWECEASTSAPPQAAANVDHVEENDGRKRIHLLPESKQIIYNVYEGLVARGCSNPIKETSELTRVPYTSVQKIITNPNFEKKERKIKKFRRISENLGVEIKNIIYESYKNNVVPTTKNLMGKLEEKGFEIRYCEDTFRLYLRSIGFFYRMLDRRLAIMETLRLKKLRFEYIHQIRKFRAEGRSIIVLDETWYDSHDVLKKGITDGSSKCVLNTPPSRGKRIIILAAGSENGWVEGSLLLSAKNIKDCSADYHQDMDGALFESWFQNQLLPNIPQNSVIVMDNAKYHSRHLIKKPSQATRKDEILNFMASHNIAVPQKNTKKDLLEILKNHDISQQYVVDETAKERGHTVLRLPPYYCVLNPIELIWSSLNRGIRQSNVAPNLSAAVVELIRQEVKKIDSNLWRNCFRHVINVENSYLSPTMPELIINLAEDSDDDETLYFENSDSDEDC